MLRVVPLAAVLLGAPIAGVAQGGQRPPAPPAPSTAPATPKRDTTPPSAVDMSVTQPRVDTVDRIVAVVGNTAITFNELRAAVYQRWARGEVPRPTTPAEELALAQRVLNDLVDEEILVQKANDLKLDVSESDVAAEVDRQVRQVRAQFQSDNEYRTELKKAGFGTPEEYRRTLLDQVKRQMLQQKAYREIIKGAKPGSVTEEDVTAAYERARADLQKRPATIAFRQIVIAPHASRAADSAAHAKAESLLVKLRHGDNFEELAKRESMDPGSAKLGGDLGWNRRGSGFVPEFEAMMFRLPPGELSPVFKTSFGYHILRVDRVQPAEVKVRHILIAPVIDSNDVRNALAQADSVAAKWRAGAKFDSLVAKYHDPAEEKGVLQPFPLDSLPQSYRTAIGDLKANQVTAPFALTMPNGGVKYAIVQVVARTEAGEYSLPEVRERLRTQLAMERQTRDILDELRKRTYVSVRL